MATVYREVQPGTTVVVVQQPRYGGAFASRAPIYMRNGIRIGGAAMGLNCLICLGISGVMFTLVGIGMISMDADQEFWAHFDRSVGPGTIMGSILLVVGLVLIIGCIVAGCFAKKKYEEMKKNNPGGNLFTTPDNSGRVINPDSPGTYPPGANTAPYAGNTGGQMPPYPQEAGGPYNPLMGGYPGGQPTPYYPSPQQNPVPGAPMNANQMAYYPPPPPAGTGTDPYKPGYTEYDSPPPYAPDFKPT